MSPTVLTLRRPDDWHVHLRDGALLRAVLPATAAHFGRALVMPNLRPPIRTGAEAQAYRQRILDALPAGAAFTPLMTLYLTEQTDADDVIAAWRAGTITGVKLYPAGATTNSDAGVRDVRHVLPTLAAMADAGVPLLIHGEVTDPDVDIFDREAAFISQVLAPLRAQLPRLRVVLEHVTTAEGVAYVQGCGEGVAATVTPHHLLINRNAMFQGGLRPHAYCLPVAKREAHRQALVAAVTSGDPRFFLGTDSAPHLDPAKESACGCAGIFNAPNALACVAQVFDDASALHHLEAFTSLSGPAFYGLPPNEDPITLHRTPPPSAATAAAAGAEAEAVWVEGGGRLTVFAPPIPLRWSVGAPTG